ncbi:hypothetical protein ACSSZE_17290 [Acidithiobacillus caldus]
MRQQNKAREKAEAKENARWERFTSAVAGKSDGSSGAGDAKGVSDHVGNNETL